MSFRKVSTAFALALCVGAIPAMAKPGKGKSQLNNEFARFDQNADGVISRSEFPADPALFDRLDRNRDGVISQSEAKTAMGDRRLQQEELRRLDRNNDGMISRDEWRGDFAAFDRLDRNRDGVISQADRAGKRQNRNANRFRGLDTNNDGMITRREWRGNDQSFRQHDRNGDGILSGSEMRSGKKRK